MMTALTIVLWCIVGMISVSFLTGITVLVISWHGFHKMSKEFIKFDEPESDDIETIIKGFKEFEK
ncbi:hypothetical protein 056SW001B_61 [Bacillus phage 056SW001B]|uniref:Uncharacterized protein n=2 Tax=Gettysburgvirus TaxID=3425034 RepID=A0A5J6T636_9CAUD|nr:hypothetical protein 019DV002_59 [Bacillus phage 019DV002]QFG05286.1 hypothetical protein 019DV004_59 [Bacillus phage 019DV004]QFR56525.1 hypothetical protein 056SW001B_61 [Bacillus phage 056SW001B]